MSDGGRQTYYPSEGLSERILRKEIEEGVRALLRETHPQWEECVVKMMHYDDHGRNTRNEFFKINYNNE